MDDIILITYEEFMKYNIKSNTSDERIKGIMQEIISNHECFSQNYKYIPFKDENYKQKLNNYRLKHKACFIVEKNDKYVFSLLNKLTTTNYKTMVSKIMQSIDQVDLDISISKIINYSKISNLYTNLICNIINELYTKNATTIDGIIEIFVNDYHSYYEVQNYLKIYDVLIYDDYDEFCDHHKQSNMMHNMLKTILQIIKTLKREKSEDEYIKHMWLVHSDNIAFHQENNAEHIHINMMLYESFTHMELMLNNTETLFDIVDKQDFLSLCLKIKLTANNKLKFKLEDLIEKL